MVLSDRKTVSSVGGLGPESKYFLSQIADMQTPSGISTGQTTEYINGHPRVPDWLAKLGIQEGEWTHESKLCLKRAMKCRAFGEAARVYACLGLHTKAFRQEKAVKMEAGKCVPLTPRDIAAETGIHRKHIRRALTELKTWGLVNIEGSTKDRVLIYAWVKPRDVDTEKIVTARGDNFPPLPEALKPFESYFKQWKIPIPAISDIVTSREYLEELEALARGYENAKMALARALKCPVANHAYKDEVKGSEIEVKPSSSSSSNTAALLVPVNGAVSRAEDDEEDAPSFDTFQKAYPRGKGGVAKAEPLFKALSLADRRKARDSLREHLAGEQWQRSPKYIPSIVTFLKERRFDRTPDPYYEVTDSRARAESDSFQRQLAMMKAMAGRKT